MIEFFILRDKQIVPTEMIAWARWFEQADRHIGDMSKDDVRVSTVFIGVDHNFAGKGPPILFETLVFGGPHDGEMVRCSTYEQAEAMHARMCAKVFGLRSVA